MEMTVQQAGNFKLIDPVSAPKKIDLLATRGDKLHVTAIFQIEGNTLKYCGSDSGNPRPTNLATREGEESYYSVWRRVEVP